MVSKIRKIIKILFYLIVLTIVFIFITFVIIKLETKNYISNNIEDTPHREVVLILGASILRDGSPSPILIDRVESAIALYKAKKVVKILVTGDNGTLSHNEVAPVRKYLLENGIKDKDIFLDYAGFDTYSSMYRAQHIFSVDSLTIVTQSFHLPRAVFIARSLRMNAYGMNADDGNYKFKNYTREMLANVKAVMDLILERKPKYLGEEIPLSDG
jgi:SanA protein